MQKTLAGIAVAIMGALLSIGPVQAAQSGWLKTPSRGDIDAVYPKEAISAGVKGKVSLSCTATPQGFLTDCKVVSEDPPKYFFGAAALTLIPRYQASASPASRTINFTITFDTYNRNGEVEAFKNRLSADGVDKLVRDLESDNQDVIQSLRTQGIDPEEMKLALGLAPERKAATGAVRLLSAPAWLEAPSWAQIDAAWPRFATAAAGDVAMQCSLQATGELKSCQVLREQPSSQGFFGAAKTLSARFKAKLAPLPAGQAFPPTMVQLVIHMSKPGTPRAAAPVINQPVLLTEPTPASIDAAFAPVLASLGGRGATAAMRCVLGPQGAVSQCVPLATAPGQGPLSAPMLSLAPAYRVTAWQQGVGPTEGASVILRLNIGSPPPATVRPAP